MIVNSKMYSDKSQLCSLNLLQYSEIDTQRKIITLNYTIYKNQNIKE